MKILILAMEAGSKLNTECIPNIKSFDSLPFLPYKNRGVVG